MKKALIFFFSLVLVLSLTATPAYAATQPEGLKNIPSFSALIPVDLADNDTAVIIRNQAAADVWQYTLIVGNQLSSSAKGKLSTNLGSGSGTDYFGASLSVFGSYQIYTCQNGSTSWTAGQTGSSVSTTKQFVQSGWNEGDLVWSYNDVDVVLSSSGSTLFSFQASNSIFDVDGSLNSNYNPGGSSDPGTEGGSGYDDNSFKGLVSDLFKDLINVILYGNTDGAEENTERLQENQTWLDGVTAQLNQVIVTMEQIPDYISSGFQALEDGQDGINELVSGIATAIPVLYYGFNGVLVIFVVRKILGR